MSEAATARADGGAGAGTDGNALADALRFEQAKNQVLLDEVMALEDEIVNRCMADFEAVVSDETREFWREQLVANRQAASTVLGELARLKGAGARGPGAGPEGSRRPLHNRALARPMVPSVASGGTAAPGASGEADERAAKIRNRAQEISRAERVPFSAAFRRAEKELGQVSR